MTILIAIGMTGRLSNSAAGIRRGRMGLRAVVTAVAAGFTHIGDTSGMWRRTMRGCDSHTRTQQAQPQGLSTQLATLTVSQLCLRKQASSARE